MATGTVEWVDAVKGYGFIAPDEGGADLFVDRPDISGGCNLFVGALVEFERRDGIRGRVVATNVVATPLADDPEQVREEWGWKASS